MVLTRLHTLIAVTASLMLAGCAASGTAASGAVASAGRAFSDCPTCPTMVTVPAGTFRMGSDHVENMRGGEQRPEGPVHTVTIPKAFAAGKFEVTNREYAAFVKATGYVGSTGCQVWGGIEIKQGTTWKDPDYGRPIKEKEPVVCVSWIDVKAYVAWLAKSTGKSYRLLSEAEWEYAARAGSSSVWPWGDDDKQVCQFGNVYDIAGHKDPRATNDGNIASDAGDLCNDGYTIAAPVGSYKPNAFGLYDMVGNVWEWTENCSSILYPPMPADGSAREVQGACEKRAVRGGAWRTRLSRQRPSFRGRDPEPTASNIFGFRVARDL